jgi:hypothetical protein
MLERCSVLGVEWTCIVIAIMERYRERYDHELRASVREDGGWVYQSGLRSGMM